MRAAFRKIPQLPLSALIFYLTILAFWKLGVLPSPEGILTFLENLYKSYGLPGMFIASFLEGIVYFGLYFPGSFVVALAVILSDGTMGDLLAISVTVAVALTITSLINYALGRRILANRLNKELMEEDKKLLSKGVFFSALHPNSLAFYFFNAGIQKHKLGKVLLVPVIIVPYGLLLGYLIFSVKDSFMQAMENPYVMVSYLLIWFFIALVVELKKSRTGRQ